MKSRNLVLAGMAAGFALGVSAMLGSSFADSAFSSSDEAAIEAVVERYLRENPDVVFEAVQSHLDQQKVAEEERLRSSVSSNLAALQSVDGGFAAGASEEDARVTVVEFFDYHCGYCKKATGAVMELIKSDPSVRVIFKEYPILVDESHEAAKAALAAREQDKYVEFHAALMRSAGKLTPKRIDDIAANVGLDVKAMRKAMNSPEIEAALNTTRDLAKTVGISGTPTFLVGDEVLPGWSEEHLMELVAKDENS